MIYDIENVTDAIAQWQQVASKEFKEAKYSVDVADGFKFPPIRVAMNYMRDTENTDMEDLVTRHCIQGKLVKFYLDGVEIPSGGFQLNNVNDPWELIPVFEAHPLAFTLLVNAATAYVIKKYTPRAQTQTPAAAK